MFSRQTITGVIEVPAMQPGDIIREAREKLGWSQAELAKRVDISQVAIMKIEANTTKQSKFLPRIAQELSIPLTKLDASLSRTGHGSVINHASRAFQSPQNSQLQSFPAEQLMGRPDLPVHSIVQGGRGALVLSSEPYTSIARPNILLGLKDAYGVLVKGNSMAREYSEGDIAYVDPHEHPKEGDACIFQSHKDDGTVEAMIKYLARSPDASETLYYLEQTNPPKKFTVKKADWQLCHVAVGKQKGRR